MNQRIHSAAFRLARAQARARRMPNTLPEGFPVKALIAARNQADETITVPVGTYIHSVSLTTTDPNSLYVFVQDLGTKKGVFSGSFVRARAMFEANGIQVLLPQPLLVIEPGLLQVTLKNTGGAQQDCELVVWATVPAYELVA